MIKRLNDLTEGTFYIYNRDCVVYLTNKNGILFTGYYQSCINNLNRHPPYKNTDWTYYSGDTYEKIDNDTTLNKVGVIEAIERIRKRYLC